MSSTPNEDFTPLVESAIPENTVLALEVYTSYSSSLSVRKAYAKRLILLFHQLYIIFDILINQYYCRKMICIKQ